MKQSLLERCEAQIRNEAAMRTVTKFEYEEVLKLCAMMHVNADREVDAERLGECGRLLKDKAGIFSSFRGTLQRVVVTKMALAEDPATYIDDVTIIYEQLAAGRKLPGEMLAMAATTIVENCPAEQRTKIAEKTREAYARIKEKHRFLTSDNIMSLIALMVMTDKDPDQATEEAEELYQTMKERYRISSGVAQSAAMVLALSDKTADQKLDSFFGLYEACRAAGHATGKDKAMVVYAAFTDATYDLAETVAAIGEVDMWLKGQKGYGALSLSTSARRLFAASMVLEDLQAGSATAAYSVTGAVAQAVMEELVLILVMIIVTSTIVSVSISNAIL